MTSLKAFALAALALLPVSATTARAPAAPAPKLIVTIVVDQFSAELFDRYAPTFTGGLGRLAGGIRFTGYQSHAATETCPGHSTILTGRHPAATGIVANDWIDRTTMRPVYCAAVPGETDAHARGPQRLKTDTLGDWLKAADPRSRVVSISGKDRAAIMLAGHRADAVYWWTDGEGFVTSRFVSPLMPIAAPLVATFDRELFARWQAAPPVLWPAAASPRCAPLQVPHRFGPLRLSGRVPPDLARTLNTGPGYLERPDFQLQLRTSIVFDPLALELAGLLVDSYKLGRGEAPDVLALSLSATDYIGHRYGNGGAEMCEQMAALDVALGAFLVRIDALGVPYVVVLTADHGSTDAVERRMDQGHPPAPRIDGKAMLDALNIDLRSRFALDRPPLVWKEVDQLTIDVADRALTRRIRDAAVAMLRRQRGVAAVLTSTAIARARPRYRKAVTRLTLAERYNESYDPERSGDIHIVFAERASLGIPTKFGDSVAGHGSPWDYDRRVPILFWSPDIRSQRRPEAIETVDIAPTLASMVQVPTPRIDGHCLKRVTASCG